MAAFRFVALDAEGRERKGTLSAENPRLARNELLRQKLTLVELKPTEERAKDSRFSRWFGVKRTSSHDLVLMTRQLATLVGAAVPVEEALRTIAAQTPEHLKIILSAVRSGVVEGKRFSTSLAAHPQVFSELYCSVVRAGETSGQLGAVLDRLADYLEKSHAMRGKVQAALIYPMALSVVALSVVVLLMVFVVPRVAEQFDAVATELPLLTKTLISVSSVVRDYWGLIALIFIGLFIVGNRLLANPVFRQKFDGFLLTLPLVGKLLSEMNAARFARTMSTVVASGTPVLQALDASRAIVDNIVIKKAIEQVIATVREGASLSAALQASGVFPPLLVYMAASGEKSGTLPELLGRAADHLEREFDSATTVAINLLEPLILIVMGVVVTGIVLAILLPILQLNTLTGF